MFDQVLVGPFGPAIIFVLRVIDVSLATLRILYAVRGQKALAAGLGFVEVLVWVLAVAAVVTNLMASPWLALAYAAGFAAGTYVGMTLEEKLAFGLMEVRVFTRYYGQEMAAALRELGYGITEYEGWGRDGRIDVLTSVVRRRMLKEMLEEVDRVDPNAFVAVDEPRMVHRGWLFTARKK